MEYRVLPWDTYPRKAHFAHFNSYANPYVGVTVEVDITAFRQACQQRAYPFFLSFLYCIGNAANAVPQLRHRILGDSIVEMACCDTSHTVLHDDGTYSYCRLKVAQPFETYLPQALKLHQRAKTESVLEDGDDAANLFFTSSIHWVHYTNLQQPTPIPADSNPRITWGRFVTNQEGRTTLPVTLLANHALVDGVHIGAFYQTLNAQLTAFVKAAE